jgi:ferredoxin
MENAMSIDQETCKGCGLCGEVCPIKIMKKDGSKRISFRQDRLPFRIRCGQYMAICLTKSIVVEGLSYLRDFFEISETPSVETPFFDMIANRRAMGNKNVTKVRDPMPDQTEDIEVALIPLVDIPELIRKGKIDHAIVIGAFTHYFLRHPEGMF